MASLPKIISFVFLILLATALPARSQLELSRWIGDGMVMQRGVAVPIRGWAEPGTKVTVSLGGESFTGRAASDGRWIVTLPARDAGGPLEMIVSAGDERREIENILVGDVWLCSGQSNMEWPVSQALDFDAESAAATDAAIRHFQVPKQDALRPAERLPGGEWRVSSPETVGDFTAVGYFFARGLRRHVDVPIGLLHASWGGSRIEPWTSASAMGYGDDVEEAARTVGRLQEEEYQRRFDHLEGLLGEVPTEDAGFDGRSAPWADPALDDGKWRTMTLPTRWESAGYPLLDGIVWFRRQLELSGEEAESAVALHLGKIDDSDITWVNGRRVGGLDAAHEVPRVYALDEGILKAGVNTIAVRVDDTGYGGGIYGPTEELYLELAGGERRPLDGEWLFRVGAFRYDPASSPHEFPTLLYNQMIHPLRHVPIRGALWYQGESNTRESDTPVYARRLEALIEDWRSLFGVGDFPFLIVQLANFNPPVEEPSESRWAEVREAQAAVLALPKTALAVTIDIGDGDDIHPRNKQDVGRRLALAARRVAYGEQIVHSGPIYRGHEMRGDEIVIAFDHVGGGLVARGGAPAEFAVAGADRRFVRATARIEGDHVVVRSDEVPEPVAVRYAWADNPEDANLYNAEGLPASPFRTDPW